MCNETERDQNNPFFQRFLTDFDVLTTNTSPLDPVIGAVEMVHKTRNLAPFGPKCQCNVRKMNKGSKKCNMLMSAVTFSTNGL